MGGWGDGWEGGMDGRVGGWMDGRMHEWMDKWMKEMDGWMSTSPQSEATQHHLLQPTLVLKLTAPRSHPQF